LSESWNKKRSLDTKPANIQSIKEHFMSTPLPQNRHRGTVPVDHGFNLSTSTINIGEKYATIQIPIGVWNDGLKDEQKKLKSPDTKIDMEAVTERMSVRIVRTAAVQTLVSQPDPRDDIPLVYSSKTRRIICLVGFVLSSTVILGVHMAANAGHVPGFQPLPVFVRPVDHEGRPDDVIYGSMFFASAIFLVTFWVALKINQSTR
jgi:hypothetical protein